MKRARPAPQKKAPTPKRFFCYLLRSADPRHPQSTYIGDETVPVTAKLAISGTVAIFVTMTST